MSQIFLAYGVVTLRDNRLERNLVFVRLFPARKVSPSAVSALRFTRPSGLMRPSFEATRSDEADDAGTASTCLAARPRHGKISSRAFHHSSGLLLRAALGV